MFDAPVGDDVFGDDPTVNELERYTADLLGFEAGMYVSSGTQSNLCGLLAHCRRGDEYIVGDNAHTFKYEGGGAAVLGSIQPQTVAMAQDGSLDLDHVARVVKPDDAHFARSRLLCLENTHDGKVQSVARMHESVEVARAHGLAAHLDGARVWNAAVDLGVAPRVLTEPFDSVSVCLSKGLGAPVGSVLVGTADLVKEARKWRKMLGGTMRQVGLIAAAGLFALEHNLDRLAEDHRNAQALADGLGTIAGVTIDSVHTNMVFATLPVLDSNAFVDAMAAEGIEVRLVGQQTRMVTHLDVSADDVAAVVSAARSTLPA